jgi:pSer/pThr/pTyr-binding forkhead associated (FHA) protein
MNTNHIARFEEIVQRLVEGTFARLFAGRLRPLEVANALAHALEDHALWRPDELPLAPNRYWVALNPADYSALLSGQPNLADDLARHLFDLAHQAGFALPDPPKVSLTPLPDVPLHRVKVAARWLPRSTARPRDRLGSTRLSSSQAAEAPPKSEAHERPHDDQADEVSDSTLQMPSSAHRTLDADQTPPTRPFLILEGQRHIPVSGVTVSLGRSLDNDVIVDDARVSRHHAQLRRRYERYVIYDLGSTGGTTVNGYPVQECVLEAGDVISLAGVEIIYGEDRPVPAPLSREIGSTPALPRSSHLPETGKLPSTTTNHVET